MFNTELLKFPNIVTLSIIILIWITIHEKVIKPHIIHDGDDKK
jgi:hypothetical protein